MRYLESRFRRLGRKRSIACPETHRCGCGSAQNNPEWDLSRAPGSQGIITHDHLARRPNRLGLQSFRLHAEPGDHQFQQEGRASTSRSFSARLKMQSDFFQILATTDLPFCRATLVELIDLESNLMYSIGPIRAIDFHREQPCPTS